MEDTLLMTASSWRDLNINQNRNEETRNRGNIEDGDFPAFEFNYDRKYTLITFTPIRLLWVSTPIFLFKFLCKSSPQISAQINSFQDTLRFIKYSEV